MGTFAVYTFVAGIVLLASYIIYKWLLSTENQPAFNRTLLIAVYLFSFIAWPAMQALSAHAHAGTQASIGIGGATASISAYQPSSAGLWFTAALWVYIVGMAATALFSVSVAVRLARLVAKGEKIHHSRYTLVLISDKGIAPFSWGRYVVMSRDESHEAAAMILSHEQAHIACRHFADLILAQIVCVVLWYNPAAWLMLSELKSVHEYQADSHVLAAGVDARKYQLLLIKKAVGVRFPSLANSLNHSKLKKRITMMYNRKTSAGRRSRALALVPAVALALALVNIPSVARNLVKAADSDLGFGKKAEIVDKVTKTESYRQIGTDRTESKVEQPDKLPQYPGGEMALMKYLMENVKYPAEAEKEGAEGRVLVNFTVGADGSISNVEVVNPVNPALDAEAIRVVKAMNVKWIPGESGGKTVSCSYILPISFKLTSSKDKK